MWGYSSSGQAGSPSVLSYPALAPLPLLLLLIGLVVLPVTWAAENLFAGRRIIAALVVFALSAGACLGYPSRSGYNTSAIDRSQAWDALRFTAPPSESTWFIAQRRFLEMFGRQPGIVLSDIDPVYLNALFPDWIVAAPLDGMCMITDLATFGTTIGFDVYSRNACGSYQN